MTTAAEKLSRLVSDRLAYYLPDTAPTAGQVITVLAAGIDQVNLGFSNVALPDPITGFTLDPLTNIITITLQSGTSFTVDLTPILVDTNTTVTGVQDVVGSATDFQIDLSDGSSVVYTPTGERDPTTKADKTTQVVSTSPQLTVTDPTLADDVSLALRTGTNISDLVICEANNQLPTAIMDGMASAQRFLRLASVRYDASGGTAPTGVNAGETVLVHIGGTVPNIIPLGATAPVSYTLEVGDLIRNEGANWRIISRSNPDAVPASKVTVTPIGTPSLGTNAQDALQALEDRKVDLTREVTSTDVAKLTINGADKDTLANDIQFDLLVNVANGLAGLDAAGQILLTQIPPSALPYHAYLDAGDVDTTLQRPSTPPAPWANGDTIIITAAGTATVVPIGGTAPVATALVIGQMLTRNAANQWFVMPTTGVTDSDNVNLIGAVGAKFNGLANLTAALGSIDANVVWITDNQTIAGDKIFTGSTETRSLAVGAAGTNYLLPVGRGIVGEALVTNGAGAAAWSKLAAGNVTFTPITGITATDVQQAISDVYTQTAAEIVKYLKLTPATTQTLQGTAGGAHTKLDGNMGVIVGDGTTKNQISRMVTNAGSF